VAQAQAAEGVTTLALPDGTAFHKTANRVHGVRELPAVASGLIKLHSWQEELPDGTMQSFYAYSRITKSGAELVGRKRATTHKIRLRDFVFDPIADGPPAIGAVLSARNQSRLYLVQLEATPLPEMRRAIEDTGARLLRFIADHAFIVEMAPNVRGQVQRLKFVRWVGRYHPAYRLDRSQRSSLNGNAYRLDTQRYSLMVGSRGASTQSALADSIRAVGGVVELIEPGGLRVEATLSHDQLLEIVHTDEVQFIDVWGGPGETDMNVVRSVGGANYVESVAGFTGQGVRGEVFDTELYMTHQEWGPDPILHSSSNTCGGTLHGTSCYSNNFATGVDSTARGVVPDAQGIFFCYGESTQFGGSTSRYTANAELIDPAGPYRAVYQTSSVGSSRTRDYTTISAETDDYLFQHQLLSTQSQSNAGNQDSRPQAWAKNIVSVGALYHENTADRCDDSWSSGASTGPADDGRIKPDLSFFYDSIRSASGSSATSYTSFGGTSSATPQTSGYFGLLFQMWHEGVWNGHGGGATVFDSRPNMATAKALMINLAYRYDWTSAGGCSYSDANRYRQGWGMADAQRLYDRASVTSIIDETDIIAPLETISYNVEVQPGESELNVTMVYTDPAGTAGSSVHRVNDLSLRVTSPGGTVYWGNNGLTSSNWSTSGGSSNTLDTVENVFIQNPTSGTWTVDVIGDEIVQDGHVETGAIDADFALVTSGGLITGGCTPAPIADAGPDRTITEGDSTTIGTAAQPDHTYLWSPGGATTAQITVSPMTTTTYTVTATNPCGSKDDSVTVTVMPEGQNGPQDAVYDSGLGAPACAIAGSECDSLALLDGRGTVGPEPNQPNTLDSCTDGTSGTYHSDESCDAIVVHTLDGLDMVEGATVQVDVTVYAWSTGTSDHLDLYYADDANNPVWTHITTIDNPGSGVQTLSAQYTLPSGTLQAVRANFRYNGTQSPCSGGSYDDADDLVFAVEPDSCVINSDCDDGLFCNGAEICNAGTCEPGTAPSCDDGVSCTTDSCNEGTDACDNVTDDSVCDNGLFCDGTETCDAVLDCQAGTPPDCNDGVGCTNDSCNEGSDSCDNLPDDTICDNGLFCDGAETCDTVLDCQAGTPPCTAGQSCNEANDICEGGSDCMHSADFTSGAGGWTNGNDTCTTGFFVVGSPDATDWQVSGGNPGNAYYTQPNSGGVGSDDVDGGTCEALSPVVNCSGEAAALISLDYFHGQRDAGDDSEDGFTIEVLNDGVVVDTIVAIGDVTHNAAWTNVSTTVVGTGNIQLRVRATDAASTGDIVEGGIDNVSITPTTPPACSVEVDFTSGAEGWSNSSASTCTTGSFVVGTPDEVISTVTTQVGGDHTTGTGNAFYSADNLSGAGTDDIDGGNCIVESPVYTVTQASDVSVWYFHGQRDAGDDASGDFFLLEISTDGGSTWSTLASNGDQTSSAAWTEATTTVPAGSEVMFRLQASDGPSAGDLVEAGLDDISICAQ
jgi:hypothetical protein